MALTKLEPPDIPGDVDHYLTWDFIWSRDHKHRIEIRHGDQVLFSGPVENVRLVLFHSFSYHYSCRYLPVLSARQAGRLAWKGQD